MEKEREGAEQRTREGEKERMRERKKENDGAKQGRIRKGKEEGGQGGRK